MTRYNSRPFLAFAEDYKVLLSQIGHKPYARDRTFLNAWDVRDLSNDRVGDRIKGLYQSDRFNELIYAWVDKEIKELFAF